jgi:hypothetical protein
MKNVYEKIKVVGLTIYETLYAKPHGMTGHNFKEIISSVVFRVVMPCGL